MLSTSTTAQLSWFRIFCYANRTKNLSICYYILNSGNLILSLPHSFQFSSKFKWRNCHVDKYFQYYTLWWVMNNRQQNCSLLLPLWKSLTWLKYNILVRTSIFSFGTFCSVNRIALICKGLTPRKSCLKFCFRTTLTRFISATLNEVYVENFPIFSWNTLYYALYGMLEFGWSCYCCCCCCCLSFRHLLAQTKIEIYLTSENFATKIKLQIGSTSTFQRLNFVSHFTGANTKIRWHWSVWLYSENYDRQINSKNKVASGQKIKHLIFKTKSVKFI